MYISRLNRKLFCRGGWNVGEGNSGKTPLDFEIGKAKSHKETTRRLQSSFAQCVCVCLRAWSKTFRSMCTNRGRIRYKLVFLVRRSVAVWHITLDWRRMGGLEDKRNNTGVRWRQSSITEVCKCIYIWRYLRVGGWREGGCGWWLCGCCLCWFIWLTVLSVSGTRYDGTFCGVLFLLYIWYGFEDERQRSEKKMKMCGNINE